jgi:hypothetical protein
MSARVALAFMALLLASPGTCFDPSERCRPPTDQPADGDFSGCAALPFALAMHANT